MATIVLFLLLAAVGMNVATDDGSPQPITYDRGYIEITVFVNKKVVDLWEQMQFLRPAGMDIKSKLREFVKSTLFTVNKVLNQVNLETRVASIEFLNESFSGLVPFVTWFEEASYPRSDHQMLLTTKHGLTVSAIDTMCTSQSYSTVTIASVNKIVHSIAHVLGHNMGALHDKGERCPYNGGNIMGSPDASRNYTFSNCSKERFSNFMRDQTRSHCLKKSETTARELRGLPLLGKLYGPDEVCKINLEQPTASHADQSELSCQRTVCSNGNLFYTVLDGTSCGTNKECSLGQCVSSSSTK